MEIKNHNSEKTNDMLAALDDLQTLAERINKGLKRHVSIFDAVTPGESDKLQNAASDALRAYWYVEEQIYRVEERLRWEEEAPERARRLAELNAKYNRG